MRRYLTSAACIALAAADGLHHDEHPPNFVGARWHLGPNILPEEQLSPWLLWGLDPVDPHSYRMPSLPELKNPALKRDFIVHPYPKNPNPGITNLAWYDPRYGPPPNTVPLYLPMYNPLAGPRGPYQTDRNVAWQNLARPLTPGTARMKGEVPSVSTRQHYFGEVLDDEGTRPLSSNSGIDRETAKPVTVTSPSSVAKPPSVTSSS